MSELYRLIVRGIKQGAATRPTPNPNMFDNTGYCFNVGSIELLMHHGQSLHVKNGDERCIALNARRVKRALRQRFPDCELLYARPSTADRLRADLAGTELP